MFDSYMYGGRDTRTFAEIFPTNVDFKNYYQTCGFPDRLLSNTNEYNYNKYGLDAIYALLIANYANDVIASYDENRFKLQLVSIIYEAGPAWQRAMAIQDRLLEMSNEYILKGSEQHSEHDVDWTKQDQNLGDVAQHPDTAGSSSDPTNTFGDDYIGGEKTVKELPYISEQRRGYSKGHTKDEGTNDITWTKDNVKGLIELLYSLDDTLCTRFVYRFKKLFKKFAMPNRPPLLYATDGGDE